MIQIDWAQVVLMICFVALAFLVTWVTAYNAILRWLETRNDGQLAGEGATPNVRDEWRR